MQVNTSVTAMSITTTSVTQSAGIEETSFDEIMQSVEACACKEKPPFPLLQKLAEIVDLAAKQGKITAAEHDEYIGLLDNIQSKLEEFRKPHHACHPHKEQMAMTPPPGMGSDPLAGIMHALMSQDPAVFLIQTDIVAFETESLTDFKAWVDKMIQEGKLSPKAQEAVTAFIEMREKFVVMLTNLKTVFSEAQTTAKVTESQAYASAISNLVQNPAAKTDTIIPKDTVETATDGTVTNINTAGNSDDASSDNTEAVVETSEEAVANSDTAADDTTV